MVCMKRNIVLICFYFVSHLTYSQDWYDDPKYYNGVVVLDDRSTIRGLLSYNQSKERLSFESGQKISASEALYFQFYDPDEKYNRYFFSHIDKNQKYNFYEVLLNGKLLLFRKPIVIKKDLIDNENSKTTLHINKNVIENQLYLNQNDTMVIIDNFEEQILPLLKDQIKAVSNYIFSKQLDITLPSDQLLIIDYYNGLFNKN